jgi:hypothetical protein
MPVCPSSLAIRIAAQVFRLPSAGWESMRAEKAEVQPISAIFARSRSSFDFRTGQLKLCTLHSALCIPPAHWCAHRAVRTVAGTPGAVV